MNAHTAHIFHTARRLAGVGALASTLFVSAAVGQTAGYVDESGRQVFAVPAELVRALRLPGEGDAIRRPAGLFMDPVHGEIFVGDSGNNRVVVFDREGLYRFEFDCADHVSVPGDIAVDSEGFVHVLGGSRGGAKLVRFDFDGIYLSETSLSPLGILNPVDMTIDEEDRLFLLDDRGLVHVLDRDGNVLSRVDVAAALGEEDPAYLLFGSIGVREGQMYVPASTLGRILVFDVESGDEIRRFGRQGTLPGELSFAAAVTVLPSGLTVVLDKMRFAVVCYAPSGDFLGEFGGKGYRDGWFYHPNLLVPAGDDRVIVGQILDARVQLCQIPLWIQRNLWQAEGSPVREVGMMTGAERSSVLGTGAGETVQEAVVR